MPDDAVLSTPRRLPADEAGWLRYFQLAEIPVLRHTALAIEDLRAIEDDIDARTIAEVVAADPLMTLKVLAHIASHHRSRRLTDVETVDQALVLLGITPFFRTFGPQPTVEDHLDGQPEALAGLMAVIHRAHRAARFALAFAAHRGDHDAPVIYEATLLHDFAEMLLWLHAPSAAMEMKARQQADPTLRSSAVQRDLLGVPLGDVQHALMQAWRLPELLVQITDDRRHEATQVRNVMLAIRIARHTAHGWDNPAIPDDLIDIAHLLNLGIVPSKKLLLAVDAET